MINRPGEHESTETDNSSETTKQPDINFLLEGTHSYMVKMHNTDSWGGKKLLSAEELGTKYSEILDKIHKQGGKLIQIIKEEVQGEKNESFDKPQKETVYVFIVDKETNRNILLD